MIYRPQLLCKTALFTLYTNFMHVSIEYDDDGIQSSVLKFCYKW